MKLVGFLFLMVRQNVLEREQGLTQVFSQSITEHVSHCLLSSYPLPCLRSLTSNLLSPTSPPPARLPVLPLLFATCCGYFGMTGQMYAQRMMWQTGTRAF